MLMISSACKPQLLNKNFIRSTLLVTFVFLLSLWAHHQSFKGDFIYDDISFFKGNESIKNMDISFLISNEYFANPKRVSNENKSNQYGYYRPVATIFYSLCYQLFKENPIYYHILNFLIHVLNVIFFFYLLQIFNFSITSSFVAATIFLLQPNFHQVIDYITGMVDTLSLSLGFSSLFLAYFGLKKRISALIFLSPIIYFISINTKETVYFMPAIILLIPIINLSLKKKVALLLPFISMFFLYWWLRSHIVENPSSLIFHLSSNTVSGIFELFYFYLEQFLLPFNGLFMQQFLDIPSGWSLQASFGLLYFSIFIFIVFSRYSDLFKASCLFLMAYFTISNLIPIHPKIQHLALYYSQHLLYIPSLGLCCLVSLLLEPLLLNDKRICRVTSYLILGLYLSSISIQTFRNSKIWSNPEKLYLKIIEQNPHNSGAHNNLGIYFMENGYYLEALEQFEKAQISSSKGRFTSNSEQTITNLAYCYMRLGQFQESEYCYRYIIENYPKSPTGKWGLKEVKRRRKLFQ